MWRQTTALLMLCCVYWTGGEILSLDTSDGTMQWTVTSANGSISVPAVVPGGVYTDLMRAGVLDDILWENNDLASRWVAYTPWVYTLYFSVTQGQLDWRAAQLVFEGLDTIAYVEINDNPILAADNMFITYTAPVLDKLQVGINILKVTFESPVKTALLRSEERYVAPNCVPKEYHGECHVNQIRKMQASFGWDWGPAFPSAGIWKHVYIEFTNSAVIRSATVHQTDLGDAWDVQFNVSLDTGSEKSQLIEGYITAKIGVNGRANITVVKDVSALSNKDGRLMVTIGMQLTKNQVSLWWPNGYGDQPLYPVELAFENGSELSIKTMNIGFRTVQLVEESATSYIDDKSPASEGLVFYFLVNGQRLFMKGSNWIPAHILPELSANETTVDHLLESAVEAHMQMLRVWGGGVYESDYFYSRCDQLGILVWQDFMFACSMYPADANFLRSVTDEVYDNVVRLQHHPSIALWAGNNENEAALRGNWYGTRSNFSQYKDDYVRLYVHTIKPLVESLDPRRTYMVSSPSNGIESEREGYIAKNPYDEHYGDTHYYNYVADGWATSTYPNTRFASEYGFQSFPSLHTLKTAADGSNLKWKSEFVEHRQHSPGGNEVIQTGVYMHLVLDPEDPDYFGKLVFYAQISQAMTIKAETEFYRQSRADWFTMGALYWQLNDVWQAPSWSSIEFGGRWKMLHYFAKNFFSPILVSPRILSSGDIEVYVINDKLVPINNGVIIVETFLYDSLGPIHTENHEVNIQELETKKTDIKINALDIKHNNTIFFRFFLTNEENERVSPYNYAFPVSFKLVPNLKEPNIDISVTKNNHRKGDRGYHYTVTINSNTVVLFLWLDAGSVSGRFIDNGFNLVNKETTVEYAATENISEEKLKAAIKFKYYYHASNPTS